MARSAIRSAAFLVAALSCAPADAALIQVYSRGALLAASTLDWTDGEGTSYATDTGFTVDGSTVTLGAAQGAGRTVLTGSTYNADFLAGDNVLAAFDLVVGPTPGPIRLTFNGAFAAAGAQIQANGFGSFTATLKVFGTLGLLDTFTITGVNDGNGDGSAPFIGFQSDGADVIESIEFDAGDGMAINSVSFSRQTIAEPSVLALMAAGLGLARLVRRRARIVHPAP